MSLEDDLLNLKEAAEITGVSEMTIRKYLGLTKPPRPNRLPNARKIRREGDTQDTWAIPLSDLHNAGLMKPKKQPRTFAAEPAEDLPNPATNYLALQVENQNLKKQIELLEANLADLRLMLGRSIETAETQKERRRFWKK
jgi:hypothetical protein